MLSPRVPDLDALQLLVTVAATGSVGAAARELSTSQQAASARLRRLEQLVGFPLLTRTPRGSRPTPEGSLLVEWAGHVLAAAEVLDSGISSLRGDRASHLRVAASLTVAEHLLPHWLAAFAAERPDTHLSLDAVNSEEVARRLLAGAADAGFVEGPRLPAGLAGRVVARDRLVLVVPPAHPWARRRRPVPARELAATRLVQREPLSGTRASLEEALSTAAPGTALAAPVLELSSTSAVRSAVLAGAGPAVLSDLAVAEELRAGRLAAVAVEGLDLRRDLRAVWRRGQRPAGPAADLLAIAARSR
ncbi:LysR family transcriptional regulator [Paenibacillus sp. TRM 82003]|nr:LysR family transcriptional regulator [Kineococcus sp. TRM81007]MCI2237382.1 LysR family transcriptional regulator [Kineococcus sp. TRM81007]MCI3926511.1 LysR family transcriptional regulator [Paenibacillus sp. TRM 82003]